MDYNISNPARTEIFLQNVNHHWKLRRFTDAKIFLDGEEFFTHKLVLAARSPVFRDYKTSTMKPAWNYWLSEACFVDVLWYFLAESKTDKDGWRVLDQEDFIRIGRIDREMFRIVLEFMYSGKICSSVFTGSIYFWNFCGRILAAYLAWTWVIDTTTEFLAFVVE